MANAMKGEVSFNVDGSTYIMIFNFNVLVELEEEFGVSVGELDKILSQNTKLKDIRTIFRIGLSTAHPKIDDITAGELLAEVGVKEASDLIGQAFAACFPQQKGGQGQTARPRTRRKANA